jgi:hypothetical protein
MSESVNISSASWSRNQPASHYVAGGKPASPLLRSFKKRRGARNVPQEIRDDPICFRDLPTGSDIDGISVQNYVGIIEDSLSADKAVGIARNFDSLEQFYQSGPASSGLLDRINEEFQRLSGYFKETPDDEESCPLVEPTACTTPTSAKRFIDLYPFQMMMNESTSTDYVFSFDTYTLILQM